VASLHNHISQTSKEDNLHVVESIMFCLLQWCMNLSLDDLVKKDAQGASLIGKVFKVHLHIASLGLEFQMPVHQIYLYLGLCKFIKDW